MTGVDPNTYRWLVHDVSERRPAHAFRGDRTTALCPVERQPMTRWRMFDRTSERDFLCRLCVRALERANKRRADKQQPPLREVTEV